MPMRRPGRFGRLGTATGGIAPGSIPTAPASPPPQAASPIPFVSDAGLAYSADELGYQPWAPTSGIEENQGSGYLELPGVLSDLQKALDPGINTPTYVNPYRTVMYSIVGIGTANPVRALTGNSKRTYLLVQNLGPGNLFLGIGVDPVAGGANVLNLVTTQVYEQIGGGVYIPPIPNLFPLGLSLCFAFCSSEYISLLADTAGTAAMIVEGTYVPPPQPTQEGT